MHDLDREMIGFFRAAGSLLDCLAGAAIGVLRLPFSIQRADAGALGRLVELAASAQGDTCALRPAAPALARPHAVRRSGQTGKMDAASTLRAPVHSRFAQ